ncbi:coiled-coil domain-containing protein [Paenibacillus sanguinis]|uniref:coiled-coil domain-containing protein n=1 Tax=Paenibacillus sanguinis TaxID=225906 RepID=UPI000379BBA3|nr:hypothetical protein [Paenibacillus sanguinis]
MRNRRLSLFLLLFLFATYPFSTTLLAAPYSTQEQQVLEQSLSVKEIDREIQRIEIQQNQIQIDLENLEERLEIKNKQIHTSRERAGARLRAYYMGEQQNFLVALLSAGSLKDFFAIIDYYNIILERDRVVLQDYQSEYASLSTIKQQLGNRLLELDRSRTELERQRSRAASLRQYIDESIALSANPEKLQAMIEELTAYWEHTGLLELRKYFQALASAMSQFPSFLTQYENSLVPEKGGYQLVIQEKELNEYLHGQNKLLQDMYFQFEQDKIVVQGSQEGLKLRVEGHYTVEQEPVNSITFHVDRLLFNGLALPDTTRQELEHDFDLGFYPKKIVPFVEATAVAVSKGTLIVNLKLSL